MTRFTLILIACALAAQEPSFHSSSRLVLVPVTVTDHKGRSVDGLTPADFQVLDNGRPRELAVDTIATGVAPIALVIAIQSSGISTAALERVSKIGAMIQPLITGEFGCAAVVSFSERVHWLQECTNDPNAIAQAFRAVAPGEHKAARMLDAAQAAITRLQGRPNARRVLLLISESRDRNSETDLGAVLIGAQTAGVTVYAATYSAMKTAFTSKAPVSDQPRAIKPKTPNDNLGTLDGAPPSKYNRKITPPEQMVDVAGGIAELARLGQTNTTRALADATGGEVFSFNKQKSLEDAIEKLGRDLHTQYVLSFAPDDSAPGYHSLEVRVPRAAGAHIRSRPGYWAAALQP